MDHSTLRDLPHRHVDVAIIGAGSAGLVAFREAAKATERVVLIDEGPGGTTCARVGCMPSKLLIAAADAAHAVREAEGFGVSAGEPVVDPVAVIKRVRRERDRFVGFVLDGVETIDPSQRIHGRARFLDDHTLLVGDELVWAVSVVIATGSRPLRPAMLDGAGDRLLTTDELFELPRLPRSVAVFGVGVIGLELGQALHRLGTRVRMFGLGGGVGPLRHPELVQQARTIFGEELALHPDARVRSVERVDDQVLVTFEDDQGLERVESFEHVLAATGRAPNVEGLGLEQTSVPRRRGVPLVDPSTMQSGEGSVFVAGDVTGHRPLLHEAADEGRIAGRNAARFPDVERHPRRSPLELTFSDPQIAIVGGGYSASAELEPVIGRASFADQGRARVMRINRGALHVYAHPDNGRLLGAELVGPRAEHLGHLLAWAHQQGMTVEQMLQMPFYHPVVEEGVRTALRDAARQVGRRARRSA